MGRRMEGAAAPHDFVAVGLASLGVEADELELAIMRAAHELYWPAIHGLLALDLSDAAPEADQDLSRAPRDGVAS